MINTKYRLISPKLLDIFYEEINLKENEVIVRPEYLSICKADQRYYQGTRAPEILIEKLPMALIHEGIGNVVYDNSGQFKTGNMVVMIPTEPNKNDDIIGENYLYDTQFRSSGLDGFMQDYVAIKPYNLIKIEENINHLVATFSELISVCVHAINRFDKFTHKRMNTIGVWGDGNVGYITTLLLKTFYPKTKIFTFGKNYNKLSYFTFADETYSINEIPSSTKIDHAFECVGGQKSQTAINQIIDLINPEGTISLLGVSEYPVSINTRKILEKGLKFFGSSRSTRKDFEKTMEILKHNPEITTYLENLITSEIKIRTIEDIHYAFEKDNQINFGKTILKWDK